MEPRPLPADLAAIQAALGPRYELGHELGRGGHGHVYAARQVGLNREVAVKVLTEGAPTADLKRRFRTEADLLAHLRHPHLVTVYDYAESDEVAAIVMEMLPNGTLAARAAAGMSLAEVCAVGLDVATGLAYTHGKGILHRDLKPANIMFAADGTVMVTDFGIAKILDGSARTTVVAGTVGYMAPEQLAGHPVYASDIYALGAVLYRLFVGETPAPPDPARGVALPENVPKKIRNILGRALRHKAEERFSTAQEFALALARAATDVLGGGWRASCDIPLFLPDDIRDALAGSPRRGPRLPRPNGRRDSPDAAAPNKPPTGLRRNSEPGLAVQETSTVRTTHPAVGTPPDPPPVVSPRFTELSTTDIPSGLAVATTGTVYVAHRLSHRISVLNWAGEPVRALGTGRAGYSGDGGPAAAAAFDMPTAIVVAPDGSLLIADTLNNRVRRVDDRGIVTTVLGGGNQSEATEPGRIRLDRPHGLATDAGQILYVADTYHHRVLKVAAGRVVPFAGTGARGPGGDGGPASQAEFDLPSAVEVGPDGAVYIADTGNRRIRRVDPDGRIATVAGQAWGGAPADGCLADRADIGRPTGVAADGARVLYLADPDHGQVWCLADDGRLRAIGPRRIPAGSSSERRKPRSTPGDGYAHWQAPSSLATDASGALYVVEPAPRRITRIPAELLADRTRLPPGGQAG